MNHKENKRPVTLEDLLQLKRAERPSPEFWVTFERELRAKQLAAIVAKRPWWRALPTGFSGIVRYRLPLGASAILAITFLSVREYQSVRVQHQSTPMQTAVASETVAAAEQNLSPEVAAVSSAPVGAGERAASNVAVAVAVSAHADEADRTGPARAELSPATMEEISQSVPWLMVADQSEETDLSPTARSIAENLAAAKAAHPELTNRFFGTVSNFEKRAMPSNRQTVDPLAQMRSPGELHRERLLASAVPASSVMSGHTSERVARRISDERLTEEAISRFGARGDRVLVKF